MKILKSMFEDSASIDLTPLLDVIFILLIAVLSQGTVNSERVSTAEENTRVAEQLVCELEEKNTILEDKTRELEQKVKDVEATASGEGGYANFIDISCVPEKDNYKIRKIVLIYNGKEENETYTVNTSNEAETWEKVREKIENMVKRDEKRPTICEISNIDSILFCDKKSIDEDVIDMIKLSQLFIKEERDED